MGSKYRVEKDQKSAMGHGGIVIRAPLKE